MGESPGAHWPRGLSTRLHAAPVLGPFPGAPVLIGRGLDELICTQRVHQMVLQGSRRLSTRRVGAVVTGPASAADTRLTAVQAVL